MDDLDLRVPVTKRQAAENERLGFLSRFVTTRMSFQLESALYSLAESLTEGQYHGGLWEFYELSNGGFYMAPNIDKQFNVVVPGNFYEGTLSSDALGIVVTLMVLSRLSFEVGEALTEKFANCYHALREYMLDSDHPEVIEMIRATD
jgi:hypothetical protein